MTSLDRLNEASAEVFAARLASVFEHSPWVAERACAKRPFADVGALHAAMMEVVTSAPEPERVALIQVHPELAGREALAGVMTAASTGEQGRLGLDRLSAAEFEHISRLNTAYRERFGFPCIVALRLHRSRVSVLDEMEQRLKNDRATEIACALEQIAHITRGRLQTMLEVA